MVWAVRCEEVEQRQVCPGVPLRLQGGGDGVSQDDVSRDLGQDERHHGWVLLGECPEISTHHSSKGMSSRTSEDGLTLHMTLIKLQTSDGVYEIAANNASSVLWPYIETQHDTGIFVRALILDVPAGKNLYAYRKLLSIEDFLKLWGKFNRVAVRFREISFDEMVEAAGMLGREGAEAFAYATDFGYEGRDDPTVIHPKDVSHSFYEYLWGCQSNSLALVGPTHCSA